MSGGNRKLKRKHRLHKWMAIMLAVLLLTEQSDVFVRAEEGVGDAPQTEIFPEEAGTDTQDQDNTADGDHTENADNTGDGSDGGGVDGAGTGMGTDGSNNADSDGGNTGDDTEGGGEQKPCICEIKCTADSVDADCPVCAADYSTCAGKDDTEVNMDGHDQCICETACTAEAVNAECPVCAADYSACAKNVGGGVNPTEGEPLEEALIADEGDMEAREVWKPDFVDDNGLGYKVIGDEEVETGQSKIEPVGLLSIPKEVTDQKSGVTYQVTRIRDDAFYSCQKLTGVEIPNSVTSIGMGAFYGCLRLSSINIPNGVTSIEDMTFVQCRNLRSIEIPDSVTSIGVEAFASCRLNSIKIPNNVTKIEMFAFWGCGNLKRIEMPDGMEIWGSAFKECIQLNCLRIVITQEDVRPATIVDERLNHLFDDVPADRGSIVFLAEDGSELTGTALNNAKQAYINAGKKDNNPNDGKWYGWPVGELSETVDTYKVTVSVQKDGQPWTVDCDRKFALSKDNGNTFVENLDAVEAGDYVIYDVTDVGNKLKTDISVKVTNADVVSDVVNYYTVSFYDGATAYSVGTPQEPQIVLSGRQAARPADPDKADYQFTGWKTADGGSTAYDFGSAVQGTTGIYASWIEKTAEQLHITASAEEGGTISPMGDIHVTKGGEQTFTITPDEGNRIKSVTVDGKDVTGELADHMARARADAKYYTFTNVTENHTIHAAFESDGSNPGGGGDNPNPGGGDNPNPGGGGDNSNPGGGSGGSGDNPNPGIEDNTGSVKVTVVSETASPQAENSAVADTGTPQASNGQENAASTAGQTASGKGTASEGKEPKTGDTSYLEVYATLAMIAGLTWLLLCFMDEARGMSEREKEVFVAAFIRWGKKGGAFRKCCAMAAIFCLLAYYHTIGKRVGRNALPENYLGQAS